MSDVRSKGDLLLGDDFEVVDVNDCVADGDEEVFLRGIPTGNEDSKVYCDWGPGRSKEYWSSFFAIMSARRQR